MIEFSFCVTEEVYDRLMEMKKAEGKDELTGNQYAEQLLEEALLIKKLNLEKRI